VPKSELPPRLHEQVQRRAYELYEQRGRQDGREMDDWLQAEHDLRFAVSTVAADVRVEVAPRSPARRRASPKPRQVVRKTAAPPAPSPGPKP
jgi:hypothetical protein